VSVARAVGLLLGAAADSFVGNRHGNAFGSVIPITRRPLRGGLLLGGALLAGVVVERLGKRNPLLRVAGTALATWSTLGGAALAAEGTSMARALDASDLVAARSALPRLSVHDPAALDGAGLARAAVESVAENTSDAVVAPLLWGAVAGVPGLLGYRAVRALDTRGDHGDYLGYASGEYGRGSHGDHRGNGASPAARSRLGWAAARLDDAANLLPSRATAALAVVCAPVVGGSAPGAWQVWRRDGAAYVRPNHGQVEAAFAGALEVRLGGRAVYPQGVRQRPVLGHGRTPDAGDLTRGVELSRVVGAVAAVVSAAVAVAVGIRRGRGGRDSD
jgi:adenosylcobinamide-phosphate synthase